MTFPMSEQAGEAAGEPYRMEIFGKRIDLVARLETPEQMDALIERLKVGKLMITPLDQIKKSQ
jgi:hypothetical protein